MRKHHRYNIRCRAAIHNEGRALRVGSTATRIADARHAAFLASCLVEAMIAAGFAPGAYQLAIGFAIPNGEIVKENADSDRLWRWLESDLRSMHGFWAAGEAMLDALVARFPEHFATQQGDVME